MSGNTPIPPIYMDRNALAERIRIAMDRDSQRAFAGKVGIGHATLRQYLAGTTEPNWSTLLAISAASGRSISWLMTGADAAPPASQPPLEVDGYAEISRYDLRASAGNGAIIFDDQPASVWRVPREMLAGFTGNANNLASIDISGDSMEPTLRDGDPVIFERIDHVDRDGVFVLSIDNELFVKRMRRLPTAQGRVAINLLSDNPDYDAITLDHDAQKHMRIHGRVIWPMTARRVLRGD